MGEATDRANPVMCATIIARVVLRSACAVMTDARQLWRIVVNRGSCRPGCQHGCKNLQRHRDQEDGEISL